MRKIIMFNHVTLDGYFAGPNGEIDWVLWSEETAQYARESAASGFSDTILFGRFTYELMAAYWPTPKAVSDDQAIADFMNNTAKIVFSKTLAKADWKNTRVVKDIDKEEILKMKQQPGKGMVIFGSGSIVSAFTNFGLIDEYQVLVHPVILGSGKPLFKGLKDKLKLKLLKTKTFSNGVVLLHYEPEKQ